MQAGVNRQNYLPVITENIALNLRTYENKKKMKKKNPKNIEHMCHI